MIKVIKYIAEKLSVIPELGKFRITFFVSISTSIGYILHRGKIDLQIILPILGVFLLASGSSAINHFQERKYDALMERTKNRPIPSNRIDPVSAFLIGINLLLIGSVVLYLSSNSTALFLGLFSAVWYNLFYTPLKRKFAFVVIPGALIGAIPPIIGWVASGGYLFDLKILMVAFFFFIWQIPHFWLLVVIHSNDYERAGFPTISKIYNSLQIARITFVWIAALVVSCFLIPIYNVFNKPISLVLLFALGIWLLFSTKNMLTQYFDKIIFRKAFLRINFYVLFVILIISIDKLIFKVF
ncbi:protoheme IX farnesyltransferase [Stygiobacter electus]|jgi:protoheme IX farnesyltransferase|uniref:Protoheme IX farnesyltransferase n=1 Tax=Stygiobacter electus TaxID=3032292 RepID=A0AAE3P3E4_9BACT|nr:protoheme IX farnesyltransferase [Stygiobacter electus]MDF1612398.1 protoheme IX farnesyltransferase [Stygiobacter electus]